MPVEQLRMFLIVGLCLVSFLLWQAWVQDYGPKPVPAPDQATAPSTPGTAPAQDAASTAATDDIPGETAPSPSASASGTSDAPAPAAAGVPTQIPSDTTEQADPNAVSVKTDVLDLRLSPVGAALTRADLLKYPAESDRPDEPFTLLNPTYLAYSLRKLVS